MFDLVIKNGLVVDGSGSPGFHADVGVKGDQIAAVGELDGSGARTLDADGCVVSPGFIDIHSHTDEFVFANPTCESKITQGVTTELCGNCGDSPAPRGGLQNVEEYTARLAEYGIAHQWQTVGEFLDLLDELPKTTNFATLVGHGTVRCAAMGYEARLPTEHEIAEMRRLVAQAMEEGAFGLSSGLIYPPGCYSDTSELIDLCRVVAPYGGVYASHLRDEGQGLLEAVDEALRIGRESGVGVQISHHKACGRRSWTKVKDTLAMIDGARESGMQVWADQYPYVATSTGLRSVLPKWVHEGGNDSLLERLGNASTREKICAELARDSTSGWIADFGGWDTVVINLVRDERNRFCEGLSVAEIARRQSKRPEDAVVDLLLEERGSIGIMHFAMHEQDVADVLKHPAVLIGSDATARSTTGLLSKGKPHPRAYGAFVRVLGKYVREDAVLPLEEAVAKMTGRTACRLSLDRRGVLAPGCFADITIFDPERISDTATFADPHKHAAGICFVIVNGVPVLDHGKLTDNGSHSPGRVLRRGVN